MLRIASKQLEAVNEEIINDFHRRVIQGLSELFPDRIAEMDRDSMAETVRLGTARAQGHGFQKEIDVYRYICLMFMLGADFDRDSRLPWASGILHDESQTDPSERISKLMRRAIEHCSE